MSTNNWLLNDKKKSFENVNCHSADNRHSNLNLNQSCKSLVLIPVQSFSKSYNDKYCVPDSTVSDKYDGKGKSDLLNKFSKISNFTCVNGEVEEAQEQLKKTSNSTTNNSTLSLHIAAYENSIENTSVAVRVCKRKSSNKSWLNVKRIVKSSPFEIPRQQHSSTVPEVMQFKASQRLLDPNKDTDASYPRLGHPIGSRCSATCRSVSKILSILSSKYPSHGGDITSETDRMAAMCIENNILDIVRTGKIPQSYYDLELKGSDFIDDSSDSESDPEQDAFDEDYVPEKKRCSLLPYSLNKLKAILDLYDDSRFSGNRLKRVNKRFRFIKNAKQISRIREQVRHCGSRNYKAKELREQLFQEFLRWKKEKQIVRDRFLVDAALEIADKLKFNTFTGSASWLLAFKRYYGIVGRKITQIVSVKNPHEEADIEKSAKEFVERVRITLDSERVPVSKIFNSDQIGFQLEMTSGRTLAFKGEKQVQAAVQSKNATSHSLSVQPTISADGKFILPALVCFYEPSGAPKCFKRDLEEFKNLHCVSTKSGKMTSELMKTWMKEIFLPAVPIKSILLLDSWSGFNQAKEIAEVKEKKLNVITIPKKTTGKVQPLDVGHNRYTKAFYRTMTDKLRRIRPNFILSQRKNIGRLLNQTMEQMAAPRFKSLIQHSFIKSGYFNHEYEEYKTPDDYCFNFSKMCLVRKAFMC
uniref:HTH CENPB-type domain-containing protein n=1 Tax=Panagrolaimus davidi TaxID=227884 RepID=A0A914PGT8_9BILA